VLQHWLKGRRSEVHEINGLVAREAKRLGLEAPANARTVEVARRIEAGEIEARPDNISLLLAEDLARA